MGSYRSKEDDVSRISTSIFVTNFPKLFYAKDLFHSSKQYGHVVDTFIPLKRSKRGKRFGFVRFINVFNVERLVNNLCMIWVDRLKLHANIARFNKTPLNDKEVPEKKEVGNYRSVNNAPRKDSGFNDTSNSFAHVVKEFASLSSLKLVLIDERFVDIHIRYMGELWLLLEFATSKSKDLFSCNVGVGSWFSVLQQASNDFTVEGRIAWVEIKGVPFKLWSEIMEESDDEDQFVEDFKGGDPLVHEVGSCGVGSCGKDSHVEEVLETRFDESSRQKENLSRDLFEIYPLLNKHKNDKPQENVESSNGVREQNGNMDENINGREDNSDNMGSKVSDSDSGCSGRFKELEASRTGGLEEVPLDGSAFTWCHKSASKMSKIDRFLISENLMNTYPNISVVTLDRYLSNHRPILLRESMFYYGPTPFRFYHYWLEVNGFNDFIIDTWKVAPGDDSNAKVSQKAKIKWSVEGDENSCFFHGMLNKKHSQLSIRGVMVDDVWIEKPDQVKREFVHHFSSRFDKPFVKRACIDMCYPNLLTIEQHEDLERNVSKEELKRAVWDCGTDKSPGPDGFTFGFFCHFWSTIKADVFEAVKYFFTNGDILKGCNSSFIALIPKIPDVNIVKDFRPISLIGSVYKIIAKILSNRLVGVLGDIVNVVQSAFIAERQILDGSFILNEVMHWCTSKKKQALIFKVDFEKACDSVRWDFLDEVLQFGFGNKWRMWIQSCLRSSRGSILINGSPTEEFQFFKVLKQGDPLSLFLFILIMETLHLSFQQVVDAGMFTGIKLSPSVTLSHMFYADDAMFLGQWNDGNIDTLVHVLECFYQASGLRINMRKRKIMGVHVEGEKVMRAASKLGCRILNGPFVYLGTKVGGTMSRVNEWNDIVDKVKSRLSKWKMKTLSIGGRLTLLKSVLGSIPIFHMSIFRVPVLAAQAKRGLGVSSFYALNRGLMLKWVWRFYSQKTALWVRVVKAIHGEDKKVGKTIKSGGAEQSQYDTISDMVREVNLVPMSDRYAWSLESSGEFSVASVRKKIDDNYLPNVSSMTRWVKYVPIKVNILAWKVKMDALPSRRWLVVGKLEAAMVIDGSGDDG
uniref:Putative RNA-directed DNA polymerase, eukaryota, reverse transcriptase zinc-binding domain protein n=1 Tax=Tanacetum cinerariifolium TaxID=118510 RepID=A0A6L2JNW6_TANCI|nr:putative RNA-directed DNA polymerase, eukaryota, reverse transcriptase zinc-binding domain protein [Tanacetum cinerariifolium]